jgi:hypothetical protein
MVKSNVSSDKSCADLCGLFMVLKEITESETEFHQDLIWQGCLFEIHLILPLVFKIVTVVNTQAL